MNITEHAIMRYLQREKGKLIVSDRTFQSWKRENQKEYENTKNLIQESFKETEFEFEGKITEKDLKGNVIRKYSFNLDKMILFVSEKENIITLYDINFGNNFEKQSNKTIFNILWSEREKIVKQLNKEEQELKIIKNSISSEEQELNLQLESLEERKKSILARKEELKQSTITKKAIIEEKKKEKQIIENKIAKPLFALS